MPISNITPFLYPSSVSSDRAQIKGGSRMLPYHRAQLAMAELKSAVYELLLKAPTEGMTNAEIGRSLGIYGGHEGHKGHISRTVLALLEDEAVAEQNEDSKRWQLRRHIGA